MSDSLQLFGLEPARLLSLWCFPGKNTGAGCHFLLQGSLPDPGIEAASLVSPALQADSLPSQPAGKPFGSSGKPLYKWDNTTMYAFASAFFHLV